MTKTPETINEPYNNYLTTRKTTPIQKSINKIQPTIITQQEMESDLVEDQHILKHPSSSTDGTEHDTA